MNRDMGTLPDDDTTAPPAPGLALSGAAPRDPGGFCDAPVAEFSFPWLNAQGNIQMIRAYFCP